MSAFIEEMTLMGDYTKTKRKVNASVKACRQKSRNNGAATEGGGGLLRIAGMDAPNSKARSHSLTNPHTSGA